MTLEDLIQEANTRGLRVNNLCQLSDLTWQANLTDGERYWDFGRDSTASLALQAALMKHLTTTPTMGIPQTNELHNTRRPRVNIPRGESSDLDL